MMIQFFIFITLIGSFWSSSLEAKSSHPKWKLSIAAVFRDDARFLKEWIDFHRLVGVEHFWLYNNASQDHYLSVLAPYIDAGTVELIEWPAIAANLPEWNQMQCQIYLDAIERSKKKSTWVAFIDTDEFLFACREDSVAKFLKPYKKYGAIAVNWQGFGTSGVERIPEGSLLIELLTLRGPYDDRWNAHVKSIVNPRLVVDCRNPHYFEFLPAPSR